VFSSHTASEKTGWTRRSRDKRNEMRNFIVRNLESFNVEEKNKNFGI
jgi:hypothetical protein